MPLETLGGTKLRFRELGFALIRFSNASMLFAICSIVPSCIAVILLAGAPTPRCGSEDTCKELFCWSLFPDRFFAAWFRESERWDGCSDYLMLRSRLDSANWIVEELRPVPIVSDSLDC